MTATIHRFPGPQNRNAVATSMGAAIRLPTVVPAGDLQGAPVRVRATGVAGVVVGRAAVNENRLLVAYAGLRRWHAAEELVKAD